jgi:hypothetical protein
MSWQATKQMSVLFIPLSGSAVRDYAQRTTFLTFGILRVKMKISTICDILILHQEFSTKPSG